MLKHCNVDHLVSHTLKRPSIGTRMVHFLQFRPFLSVFGLRSGPDGSGHAVGFIWFLFRGKPSILDPFRAKLDFFGPDPNFGQPGLDLG